MAKPRRQARPCSKTKRDGSPCNAFAINGGMLCRNHMRSSPAAATVVQEKLAEQKAKAVAEARIIPSGESYELARSEMVMKNMFTVQSMLDAYEPLAAEGDEHAMNMMLMLTDRQAKLLALRAPVERHRTDLANIEQALDKAVRLMGDGSSQGAAQLELCEWWESAFGSNPTSDPKFHELCDRFLWPQAEPMNRVYALPE